MMRPRTTSTIRPAASANQRNSRSDTTPGGRWPPLRVSGGGAGSVSTAIRASAQKNVMEGRVGERSRPSHDDRPDYALMALTRAWVALTNDGGSGAKSTLDANFCPSVRMNVRYALSAAPFAGSVWVW